MKRAIDAFGTEPIGAGSIVWLAGDERTQTVLSELLAAELAPGTTIQKNARRTLREVVVRGVGDPDPRRIVIKTHHLATGRHRLREGLKRRLGWSPARREWRALVELHAAGVPVPRPLAYGRLASGDELIAVEFISGTPLRERFARAEETTRNRLVANLSSTLARLHAMGHVHGDLHLGNLRARADTDEIVLLDLQRLRPARRHSDRLRDHASLELSLLRAEWPAAQRATLRRNLAVYLRMDPSERADFDAALRRFAADHVRGRARRRLRAGRGLEQVCAGRLRGLLDASLSQQELLRLLDRAERSPARLARREGQAWIAEGEIAGRAVIVKWRAGRGLAQRLVACARGTSAARAFRQGGREQLLLARSARPLAYLEERSTGLPGATWLILECVGDVDLDAYRPSTPAAACALAQGLGDWLADLHALGLGHADLKGSNLRLRPGVAESPPRFWLVDLEDLHGPKELGDEARLKALAQLNASIPDAHFGPDARLAFLARYLARLPFTDRQLEFERAKTEIVRRSLARGHRWRGEGCAEPQSVVTVSQRK